MQSMLDRTEHGTFGEAMIAEEGVSPLSNGGPARMVELASEAEDSDAGRWIDVQAVHEDEDQ